MSKLPEPLVLTHAVNGFIVEKGGLPSVYKDPAHVVIAVAEHLSVDAKVLLSKDEPTPEATEKPAAKKKPATKKKAAPVDDAPTVDEQEKAEAEEAEAEEAEAEDVEVEEAEVEDAAPPITKDELRKRMRQLCDRDGTMKALAPFFRKIKVMNLEKLPEDQFAALDAELQKLKV